MTSISGGSSSSVSLQAQQFLQQLLKQEQRSKKDDDSNSSATNTGAASLFASQIATANGASPASSSATATPDLAQLFSALDTNGDGSVSKDEFNAAFQNMNSNTKSALLSAQEQQSALNDLYSKADTDGDGEISESEFDTLAKTIRHGHHDHHSKANASDDNKDDPNKISSVFDSLDSDQDGQVLMEEVLTTVQKDSANITSQGVKAAAEHAGALTVNSGNADLQISQNTASLMRLLMTRVNIAQQQVQAVSSTTA